MRVGVGFDAHAFDEGRVLVLGGVTLEGAGLSGHSDADVVSHSIADALLGAARLGDLGDSFPPTEEWQNASSLDILEHAAKLLERAGWRVVNVDVTVIAQRPKLGPHRARMADNVAHALRTPAGEVSIKATTTDGMGFTGRGEGIASVAVVLIDRAH